MTSKLPWAAVTILVVAAVGAWALWGQGPATPPTTTTPTGQWIPIGFAAGTGGGIENVYFMDNTKQWVLTDDLKAHENLLENNDGDDIIMTDNDTFTSPYVPADNGFALVVALTLKETDNVYATYKDNFKVELTFGTSFPAENSNDSQETLLTTYTEGDATIRVNVEFDNDFSVALGGSADITVKLWTWQAA